MKAIILAAGKGTRLLPLTKDIPVCLLDVAGKTILERQVDMLKLSGVSDIIVVAGHGGDYMDKACAKLDITCIHDPFYDVGGIALSLWVAKNDIDGDTIILYSDILFDKEVLDRLINSSGEIVLAMDKLDFDAESEKVFLSNGNISGIKKSMANDGAVGEFMGLIKFSRLVCIRVREELDYVIRHDRSARFTNFVNHLIEKKTNVEIIYNEKTWFDIDFEADLKEISAYYSKIN